METSEKEIFERLTALEQGQKALEQRQDRSDELVKSVYEMAVEVKNMRETLNNVVEQVEEVKSKPAKRWEILITAFISAGGSALITWLITNLGG